MCGICGYAGWHGASVIREMTDRMVHRGPDSSGSFEEGGVALGMRRLKIIDLESGDQPIFNEDETVATVFNGEIYNYRQLRTDLEREGHRFRTRSDTEVLVHLYEQFGDDFPTRLRGMFSVALFDRSRRRLILARDPVGIKPLLYSVRGDQIVFGSEAKALLAHPNVEPRLDKQGLHFLLNLRYVAGEHTLFEGIRKLPPGTLLTWEDGRVRRNRYHRFDFSIDRSKTQVQWSRDIDGALAEAVDSHLVSDVPLGVYLSGGIDSSALVSYIEGGKGRSVDTFALGFHEPTDENDDARFVADHFGTTHHSEYVRLDPLRELPKVIGFMEEPKINQLQGFLLSRYARQHVKVVLSGLGGDELFGGYVTNRFYAWGGRVAPWVGGPVVRTAAGALSSLLYRSNRRWGRLGWDELRRGAQMFLRAGEPEVFYLILRNAWDVDEGAFRTIYGEGVDTNDLQRTRDHFRPFFREPGLSFLERALAAEFQTKLVDDFLVNEDRTSMANSMESRVPFLDQDLVQLCLGMPGGLKVQRGRLKVLLKKALRDRLPERVLEKPKWGFAFNPYEQYRKDLRTVARRVLTRKRLAETGWFNPTFVEGILAETASPKLRWHYAFLWLMVGFDLWHRIYMEGDREPTDPLEAFYHD